jgi:4-aminobutyrate aminotransferase-like enzyme
VLDVLDEEQLLPHVLETGEYLRRALRGLAGRHVLIGDVRGAGLMTGVELVLDRETRDPASHEAAAVVNAMREGGVLIQAIGPADNVLKIRPPLVFTTEDADSLVRTLDDALSSLRP